MTQSEDKSWYLILTKPNQEQVALENLERQSFEAYLPRLQVCRRRQKRHQWVCEPMFPRYLFIRLSLEHDDWGPIRSTRGVITMVRFGGLPARIPDTLVNALRENEIASSSQCGDAIPEFKSGSVVRVVEGAFAGYEGIFEAQSGAKRASILLTIADKFTRVNLSIDDLDAIKN